MKYLIVGLGNIGEEYKNTRHNIGFMVLDYMAEKMETIFLPDRLADSTKIKHRGKQLFLIKPSTYMNLSGKSVRYHLEKNNIPIENLIVITDDIALPFAKCRMRGNGSDGGHNGLKSINELLNTQQYARIRFGVGNDFPKGGQADYVLSDFTTEEMEALPPVMDKCVLGILSFIMEGVQLTMNRFNSK